MSSAVETKNVRVKFVAADDRYLIVTLSDGRQLSLPLQWYPRLRHGTPAERNNWRLIGRGEGVHWPDLDEDLSVEGFIAGRKSGESRKSLSRWLAYYSRGEKVPVRTLPLPAWASKGLNKKNGHRAAHRRAS